jgi:uncharacterized membrane protein YoaK (UPF0700 family)
VQFHPARPTAGSGGTPPEPVAGWADACVYVLTVAIGLIDAIAFLGLGHVFVGNVTGTIVFLAFASVGRPGFSVSASLWPLAGFVLGVLLGAGRRPVTAATAAASFARCVGVAAVLLTAVAVSLSAAGSAAPALLNHLALSVSAAAIALINLRVRGLAPGLRPNVLTTTVTQVASFVRQGRFHAAARQLLSIACFTGGALAGATLLAALGPAPAFVFGDAIVVAVGLVSAAAVRRERSGPEGTGVERSAAAPKARGDADPRAGQEQSRCGRPALRSPARPRRLRAPRPRRRT